MLRLERFLVKIGADTAENGPKACQEEVCRSVAPQVRNAALLRRLASQSAELGDAGDARGRRTAAMPTDP